MIKNIIVPFITNNINSTMNHKKRIHNYLNQGIKITVVDIFEPPQNTSIYTLKQKLYFCTRHIIIVDLKHLGVYSIKEIKATSLNTFFKICSFNSYSRKTSS